MILYYTFDDEDFDYDVDNFRDFLESLLDSETLMRSIIEAVFNDTDIEDVKSYLSDLLSTEFSDKDKDLSTIINSFDLDTLKKIVTALYDEEYIDDGLLLDMFEPEIYDYYDPLAFRDYLDSKDDDRYSDLGLDQSDFV